MEKSALLKSRRFWVAVLDAVIALALFYVSQLAPTATDMVKFTITALQPVIGLVIVAFTVDDINATSLEKFRMTMALQKPQ